MQLCLLCCEAEINDRFCVAAPCGHCYACSACIVQGRCAICRAHVASFGSTRHVDKVFLYGIDLEDAITIPTRIIYKDPCADGEDSSGDTLTDACAFLRNDADLKAALRAYVEGNAAAAGSEEASAPRPSPA